MSYFVLRISPLQGYEKHEGENRRGKDGKVGGSPGIHCKDNTVKKTENHWHQWEPGNLRFLREIRF